jgi:hypothetical protein
LGNYREKGTDRKGQLRGRHQKLTFSRNATKKWEDELKHSTEANETQGREVAQVKDENKGMKAKEDQLMEEVGRLKEEIRQRAAEQDSHVKELAEAKDLWNTLRVKPFPPCMKKGKAMDCDGDEVVLNVTDGIIAHLTRECGGNVHDCHVIDVTSGLFEKETRGANPYSGAYCNNRFYVAKNVADLGTDPHFYSAYRREDEDIPHTRNNWICYDFRERRIVPTRYIIRTNWHGRGGRHLKSWLVET